MIPIKILRTVRLFFLRLIKELKLLFTKHALNSIFQRILKKKKKKNGIIVFNIDNNNNNKSFHINRMISERSRDTEYWSNDAQDF